MQQINVTDLNVMLSSEKDCILIDVREDWEREICHINTSTHIPMSNIPTEAENLDKEKATAVMCHHGMRSQQVCLYLESLGFSKLYNVNGGIDAWAREIDTTLELY